ncbi:hypothetical protein BC830DRAFT_731171 [Chytriomyces sp. MP71]|nr:hypothetical protein BC830DRAFT_731171 [Chytriomyces sp. MP71]
MASPRPCVWYPTDTAANSSRNNSTGLGFRLLPPSRTFSDPTLDNAPTVAHIRLPPLTTPYTPPMSKRPCLPSLGSHIPTTVPPFPSPIPARSVPTAEAQTGDPAPLRNVCFISLPSSITVPTASIPSSSAVAAVAARCDIVPAVMPAPRNAHQAHQFPISLITKLPPSSSTAASPVSPYLASPVASTGAGTPIRPVSAAAAAGNRPSRPRSATIHHPPTYKTFCAASQYPLSARQVELLEEAFGMSAAPSNVVYARIAERVGVPRSVVMAWFQKKRSAVRLESGRWREDASPLAVMPRTHSSPCVSQLAWSPAPVAEMLMQSPESQTVSSPVSLTSSEDAVTVGTRSRSNLMEVTFLL